MSTTEQTRAAIVAYINALQTGDIEQCRAAFTPDGTWTLIGNLPTSRTWTGPDEIFDGFLAQMTRRFDPAVPMTLEVHTVLADGDRATAEWTTRATTVSGAEYVNTVVILFRVSDGKIATAREYFDTAYADRILFADN
ncbi:nuclear transport factor 2 family protein [Nocardia sp. NBC_00403]|uniref:nuclear transport factor 2 family protein n=1 Tax=Nocardia sp. NBC_00403 TaxID=2975990 RepID=UPI002E225401